MELIEIKKALALKQLNKGEIMRLLSLYELNDLKQLFHAARQIRTNAFQDKIFTYGFIYFSTWCRNDCNFCYYRKSNDIERYRKKPKEVVEIAKELAQSGVNLIDLTMGEDVSYHEEDFASVLEIVKEIKESTGLPIMLSPGVISKHLIDQFSKAGVEWYALYQETYNRQLFSELRVGQNYDERLDAKRYAKEHGMLIEEGILTGIGESISDIAESILKMGEIGAKQVRAMSFVPQKGIPMESVTTPDRELELKIIAILRLVYPNSLIPASLDVDGIAGLQNRINAGANLVTSIIPPRVGLAGVAQSDMDVDSGGRTVNEVVQILNKLNLRIATNKEYKETFLTSFEKC